MGIIISRIIKCVLNYGLLVKKEGLIFSTNRVNITIGK